MFYTCILVQTIMFLSLNASPDNDVFYSKSTINYNLAGNSQYINIFYD